MSLNVINFFKSLSDPTRLHIVLLIAQHKELCVCELTSALSLSQPKISRHLALLKSAELLTTRKQGKWVYYSLSLLLEPWCEKSIQLCLAEHQDVIEKFAVKQGANNQSICT